MMNWLRKFVILILVLGPVLSLQHCKPDDDDDDTQTYDPTPYSLEIPEGLPDMEIPADNPLTVEGVELGRHLFYEKRLSGDNTMSCASCHDPAFAFTDHGNQFSTGIDGMEGRRNAMAIINIGWMDRFFWDGRTFSAEDQALRPVPDPIEMHETWEQASAKLQDDDEYPEMFRKAFGTDQIDSMLIVKAIAQFERTMISANSKFDKFVRGEVSLTPSEANGFAIFTTEQGDCFHCHPAAGGLFTDNEFHNNGLEENWPPQDKGLFEVTGNPDDIGLFKSTTLRNIELTAPYMHDGRFATLEEVIDHYNSGGHDSPTIDPNMKHVGDGLQLTEQEQQDLLNFLKTLTDQDFINNTDFHDPNL